MKKLLLIFMCVTFSLSICLFASCGNKPEANQNSSSSSVPERPEIGQVQDMDGFCKIYDFESQREINSIKAFWDFGKMQVSDKHVTSGDHSMRLEVLGTYPDYHFVFGDWEMIDDQYLQFYVKDNYWIGLETPDASAYDSFIMDIYNDSDREIPVSMQIVTEAIKNPNEEIRLVNIDLGTKTLKKGENKAEFKLGLKAKQNGINKLKYIKFIIPNHVEGEQPAVLYVDNFRAKIPLKEKTFTKVYEKNEILFFEDDLDSYMFTNTVDACQYKSFMKTEPTLEHATQGNRAMMVTQPVKLRDYFWEGNISLHMSSSALAQIDLTKYAEEDYVIKADVMLVDGAQSKGITFFAQCGYEVSTKTATLYPDRKNTITIDFYRFGKKERLYDLGFKVSENTGSEPVRFIVDNIRFEKK